eukprot:COSAG06_NODE_7005_length_2663_cov_8.500581_1_plen_180_part_00
MADYTTWVLTDQTDQSVSQSVSKSVSQSVSQSVSESRRTLQLVLDSGRVPSPANRFAFAPSAVKSGNWGQRRPSVRSSNRGLACTCTASARISYVRRSGMDASASPSGPHATEERSGWKREPPPRAPSSSSRRRLLLLRSVSVAPRAASVGQSAYILRSCCATIELGGDCSGLDQSNLI